MHQFPILTSPLTSWLMLKVTTAMLRTFDGQSSLTSRCFTFARVIVLILEVAHYIKATRSLTDIDSPCRRVAELRHDCQYAQWPWSICQTSDFPMSSLSHSIWVSQVTVAGEFRGSAPTYAPPPSGWRKACRTSHLHNSVRRLDLIEPSIVLSRVGSA